MDLQKKKLFPKVLKILSLALVLHVLFSFFITKVIYDSVFSRYDSESTDYTEGLTEEVSFLSGESRLYGQLYDSPGNSLVIIAQGINSHSSSFAPWIDHFLEKERDVFIFDMTGSCKSEGDSAIGFSQAVLDLDAALDFIEDRYSYESIYLFGHSRGGYSACCVLSLRDSIDGVVSVNSPDSPMDAVIAPTFEKIGPVAFSNYPMLWLYQSMIFNPESASLSASEVIEKSNVPVLVVHSKNDSTIPMKRFSLYSHIDKSNCKNVELVALEGDHTSVLYSDGDFVNRELANAVDNFFDNTCENGGE